MSARRFVGLPVGLLALVLGFAPLEVAVADAATVAAATCTSGAVQSAIGSARSGDVVTVPAGSCSKWDVTVPDGKRITLEGAGATAIRGGTLDLGRSGSRVTGFAFAGGFRIDVDGEDWRIDHNTLVGTGPNTEVVLVRSTDSTGRQARGLIDHNTFLNGGRILVAGFGAPSMADAAALAAMNASWAKPTGLGDLERPYVEDNLFDFSAGTQLSSGAIDVNYGGSFVFRRNSLKNASVEVHSLQQWRASRAWEIYENAFEGYPGRSWTPGFIRGGTGVAWGNVLVGTWSTPHFVVDVVRAFEPVGRDYGACNGKSTADGNEEPNGWPCRDQLGRGQDVSLSRPSSSTATARGWARQSSEPAHFWNNTGVGGATAGVFVHNNTGGWIRAGRDYILDTPKPGYTAGRYPHRLAGGASAAASVTRR